MLKNYEDLNNYKNHIIIGDFKQTQFQEMFCFYMLNSNATTFEIKTKIIININLECRIEVNGEIIKDVAWLNMKNKISCWNQLQNIITRYGSVFWQHEVNNKMAYNVQSTSLKQFIVKMKTCFTNWCC